MHLCELCASVVNLPNSGRLASFGAIALPHRPPPIGFVCTTGPWGQPANPRELGLFFQGPHMPRSSQVLSHQVFILRFVKKQIGFVWRNRLSHRLPTTAYRLLALFFRGRSWVQFTVTPYPHGTCPSFRQARNWVCLAQSLLLPTTDYRLPATAL